MPLLPPEQVRMLGALSTVGLSFVVSIVLGTALGVWIDRTFGTGPWGLLIFFVLGFLAGVLGVYRAMKPYLK
jgi:ATP synthase protein I